jgi:hypothetical protein
MMSKSQTHVKLESSKAKPHELLASRRQKHFRKGDVTLTKLGSVMTLTPALSKREAHQHSEQNDSNRTLPDSLVRYSPF